MKELKHISTGFLLGLVAVACMGAAATFTKYPHVAMLNQNSVITNATLGVTAVGLIPVTQLTNTGASGFASKVLQHDNRNVGTNFVVDVTSLTNTGAGGFPAKVVQANEAGLITNATSVATDTNAVANSGGQATNLTVTTALTLNGLSGDSIRLAVRSSTGQSNNVFAVQTAIADLLFGVATNGTLCFGNVLTNATKSTNPLFFMVITNKGTAFVLPLYGLSD